MRRILFALLLPLLLLDACRDDQPTGPTSGGGPGGPALSHTPGHKVVNSLADPGDGACDVVQCTLREAIRDPASTEISFAAGLTGAVTLASPGAGGGPLVIDKPLTITAPSAGITIRRRGNDPGFRIVTIGSDATVRLTNLTLRNGRTDRPGGGIINFGTLILNHCTVAGNTSLQHGGGIDNHGPLTITNTRLSGNAAILGGGIDNHRVEGVTLTNSTVAHNSGGGIVSRGGTLRITGGAVANNTGSGISYFNGTSSLDHVRIVGNSGAGISFGPNGGLTLTNSTVARNSGDGINNGGSSATITGSTIANNSGTGIVAESEFRNGAGLSLINSTVSGNSSGGISVFDDGEASVGASLVNSTVAFNSSAFGAGGIRVGFDNASLFMSNTVVAENTAPDLSTEFEGNVGASFSLIGDGSGSGITNGDGNQVGNVSPNTSPVDPQLGPLANNGGPTLTHALLDGSPAIDAASTPDCPITDQRGVLRPQGTACDIGSYERD